MSATSARPEMHYTSLRVGSQILVKSMLRSCHKTNPSNPHDFILHFYLHSTEYWNLRSWPPTLLFISSWWKIMYICRLSESKVFLSSLTVCLDTSFVHSAPDKVENKEHMSEEILTFLIHKSRQYIIWSTSYPHKFDNDNEQLFRMYCQGLWSSQPGQNCWTSRGLGRFRRWIWI